MSLMQRFMEMQNNGESRKKKKLVKEKNKKEVDSNTGEKMHEKNITVGYSDREPDYIKLYLNTILEVNGLTNGLQKVVNVLLKRMSYDNLIVLNAYIKKQMAEELGYKTVQ